MEKAALVLEGGALRSVYQAGVLDVFMEHKIEFEYVLGVSAGALNAGNYISKQIGRSARVNIDYVNDPRYIGVKHLIKDGSIFNFDFLFGEPTKEWMPYDETAFLQSQQRYLIAATNCKTAKQEYFERHTYDELTKVLRASSSLPILSVLTYLDGVPYIDGGVSNAIPFEKAQMDGYKKIVIVLTRPAGFRKRNDRFLNPAFKLWYRKYPELVHKLCTMPERYNHLLEEAERLGRAHAVFLIRPSGRVSVRRVERNQEKLRFLYQMGKTDAEQMFPDMQVYLES